MTSPKQIWQALPVDEKIRLSKVLEEWSADIENRTCDYYSEKDVEKDADINEYVILRARMQAWINATPEIKTNMTLVEIGQYLVAMARQREIALICLQNRPNSPELDKLEQ